MVRGVCRRYIKSEPIAAVLGDRYRVAEFRPTAKPAVWNDAMTGLESISLGADEYRKLLGAAGISIAKEYQDVGENHYFDGFKGK
jgi:hypothetical protein